MDLATVLGMVIGTGIILMVMLVSGSLLMYWDLLSLVIVMGGAICSSMMRWPMRNFIGGVKVAMGAIFNNLDSTEELIDRICDLADIARKNSLIALENVDISNAFLKKGIQLAVDGTNPEDIGNMLNDEIGITRRRLKDGRGILADLGESAPAFGMIGTVIGLIVIMANLTDPSKIGPGLAVALVTTLYGALAANMFFIPIEKKLAYNADQQLLNYEVIRTGVDSILAGENPRLIRTKLEAYIDDPGSSDQG